MSARDWQLVSMLEEYRELLREARCLPSEKAIAIDQMIQRFSQAAGPGAAPPVVAGHTHRGQIVVEAGVVTIIGGGGESTTPAVQTGPGAAPVEAARPQDWPECLEFYELMQAYRHVDRIAPFGEVTKAYEAVKAWLRASRYNGDVPLGQHPADHP